LFFIRQPINFGPQASHSGIWNRIHQRALPDYMLTRLSRQPDIWYNEYQLAA